MPVSADALAADTAEFLTLLTTGDLEPEKLATATGAVVLAVQNPTAYFDQYLDEEKDIWLRDCGASMTEVALTSAVADSLCISDKADELYEQISEAFGEPLPEPPQKLRYLRQYMRFADEQIRQRGPQPGGYELLEFADSFAKRAAGAARFAKEYAANSGVRPAVRRKSCAAEPNRRVAPPLRILNSA